MNNVNVWNDCPLCGTMLSEYSDGIKCPIESNTLTYTRSHYYVRYDHSTSSVWAEVFVIDAYYLIVRTFEQMQIYSEKKCIGFEYQIDFSKLSSKNKIEKLLLLI